MGEVTSGRRMAFETARLALARLRVDVDVDVDVGVGVGDGFTSAARTALELCARTIHVERVGVWIFDPDRRRLACRLQYLQSTGEATAGDHALDAGTYPIYWAALEDKRAIIADDARSHPLTRELATSYLVPRGITSLLDAPIYRAGEVVGVVCHEHVGPAREWTPEEVGFASSVGDLLSMVFEQVDRLAAETELRTRAAKLISADRLAVCEQMSRAVAHDFNNVLTAIHAIGSRLERRGVPGDPDLARTLHSCAELGGHLVEQLRRFGDRSLAGERLPLRDIVERIRPILDILVRHLAELIIDVDVGLADDATTTVPVDELEQIILNLCLNARDAIDGGGQIRITLRAGADHLILEITDDGEGMTPEVASRIFEPYFTTKPSGTGLGLATVRSIADHRGIAIEVASQPGRGTTFQLRLPRA